MKQYEILQELLNRGLSFKAALKKMEYVHIDAILKVVDKQSREYMTKTLKDGTPHAMPAYLELSNLRWDLKKLAGRML